MRDPSGEITVAGPFSNASCWFGIKRESSTGFCAPGRDASRSASRAKSNPNANAPAITQGKTLCQAGVAGVDEIEGATDPGCAAADPEIAEWCGAESYAATPADERDDLPDVSSSGRPW